MIKEFLEHLENDTLFEQKDDNTFKKEELVPVVFDVPSEQAGELPPLPLPKGGGEQEVEVVQLEEPKEKKGEKPTCPTCGGSGEHEGKTCPTCDGEGEVSKEKAKKAKGEAPRKEGEPKEGEPKAKEGEAKITTRREIAGEEVPPKEGEQKLPSAFDSHEILGKGDASDARELAKKILEKGEERRRTEETEKERGLAPGSFIDKLREIYKPKVDWVRELKKRIQPFKSRTAKTADKYSRELATKYKPGIGHVKTKSYATWLKNPKSHSQVKGQPPILFKGPYVKAPIAEIILIVALDTSGSIPARTVEKVFGEMDSIARSFKSGMTAGRGRLEGKVYFMTWDIGVKDCEIYKPGQWKQYVEAEKYKKYVKGGGGTDLSTVYEYINGHFNMDPDKSEKFGLLNVLKSPTKTGMNEHDIILPIKEGKAQIAPFLIIATDGYFGEVNDQDLGRVYQDNHDSIVHLIIDGTDKQAYPKNVINYESYRI